MTTKNTIVLSLLLIALALVAGAVLWTRLPEQMASHWNANDEVDGYLPKIWGVLLMPAITTGLLLLFLVVPALDPLKANVALFRAEFNIFITFMMIFLLYVHALTLVWSLGWRFRMSAALLPMMGALFIAVGYLLKGAKRNYFIGIRTPWTLASDSVWEQTHRLGARLFYAAGVFAMLGGVLGGAAAFLLTLLPLLGVTLFLVAYSYVLYHREAQS